jgi:hypothetical protein
MLRSLLTHLNVTPRVLVCEGHGRLWKNPTFLSRLRCSIVADSLRSASDRIHPEFGDRGYWDFEVFMVDFTLTKYRCQPSALSWGIR